MRAVTETLVETPELVVAGPPAAAPVTPRYRPHLDGLRAVAVFLVVAFHAGLRRFQGGFIGVDVFFVLSGYLVTELLLRDIRSHGSVRVRRFYARRIRRLLPAALVTLVITAIVYAAIASPVELFDARHAFQSALLYVSNWYFIHQSTDYFASDINASPVLQFWSLSIEEQFYFVWPLLLWGLFSLSHRSRHSWSVVQVTVAGLGLASLVAALRLASSQPNLAYFGTFTRAYQLLAGALLALTPGILRRVRLRTAWARWMPLLALVAIAALVLLATSLVDVGPITRGALVVVATCALLLAIETGERGAVRRGLSVAPIVYLGRISYGIYLWHWPIIIVAAREFSLAPLPLFAIAALLATGLASLSYQLLEQPIRISPLLDRVRGPVIVTGLALSVLTAAIVVPRILDRGATSASGRAAASTAAPTGAAPVPKSLDWQAVQKERNDRTTCLGASVSKCTLVHGKGPSVLLMGDSHALMLIPTLSTIAERDDLTFSVAAFPQCPWLVNVTYALGSQACESHRDDWFNRVIPALKPDLVVLVQRSVDDPTVKNLLISNGRFVDPSSPGYDKLVLDGARQTLDRLRAVGAQTLIVEPMPLPVGFDPLQCISGAKYLDECRFVTFAQPTPFEHGLRDLANGKTVQTLDVDKWVCPYAPICDPVVDGMIVRRDLAAHLTRTFATSLAPRLESVLQADGFLSAPAK
jgi:peptidoglycan/LPS O-acetylase OafA/YrhL